MLLIPSELEDSLQNEGVTREVIEQALDTGRKAGAVVVDEKDGCLVTHAEVGSVTVWVRYRPRDGSEGGDARNDGDVEVVGAWCHRIHVAE